SLKKQPLSRSFVRLLEDFWNSAPFQLRRRTLASAVRSLPLASSARPPSLPLGISKFRLRQLEAITLIRDGRENGHQDLAYNARPFVLCGLPLRPPSKGQFTYTRRNGKFFLEITGHPKFGLPTVRADCTCAPLAFGMGRNISSLPPAARSAI